MDAIDSERRFYLLGWDILVRDIGNHKGSI